MDQVQPNYFNSKVYGYAIYTYYYIYFRQKKNFPQLTPKYTQIAGRKNKVKIINKKLSTVVVQSINGGQKIKLTTMSFPAFSGLLAILIAAATAVPDDIPTCNTCQPNYHQYYGNLVHE